jgi:hypothetical protein
MATVGVRYRYGEALKNEGVIPQGQGVYSQSATQLAELGTRVAFADGRVFRYAKAGAVNLSPGKFVKAGGIVAQTNVTVTSAAAVGSYNVTLTTSSAITTAEEGFLQINDEAGEGIQYKIKSCAANTTTATSTDIELYDPIATALTTSSQATVLYNPYEQAEIASAVTDLLLGVPPIVVTAEYYFWAQTWGVANVYSEGTPAAGTMVQVSINSNPAGVTTCAADTTLQVGFMLVVGVDTEYKPVWLNIAP